MISFKNFIQESINDKGIFKAIFVIGIPGSGKSYSVKQLKGVISPRIVNTDSAVEYLSKKLNMDVTSSTWRLIRDKTHKMTKEALLGYLDGVLPLFIDGTSNDASNILHRIGILESIGYDVGIVHVSTPLDVAIKRAEERARDIRRHVDEDFIRAVYERNAENVQFLKSKVSFFKEIKNDSDELSNATMEQAFVKVQSFFSQPLENPVGRRTLKMMQEKGEKYLTPNIMPRDVLKKKIDGWYKT